MDLLRFLARLPLGLAVLTKSLFEVVAATLGPVLRSAFGNVSFSWSRPGWVPALAAHIRKILDERASHSAPKTRFLDELEDHMAEDAAEESLKTVVSWARFGELFSYDDDAAMFSLENPT